MNVEREIQLLKERQDKLEESFLDVTGSLKGLIDALQSQNISIFDAESAESEPPEKVVEIVSLDIKMVEDDDYMEYPFKLRLKNKSNNPVQGSATIKFLDSDGFEVDDELAPFTLAPNEDSVLTGKKTIYDQDKVERVDNVTAIVEVY